MDHNQSQFNCELLFKLHAHHKYCYPTLEICKLNIDPL